MIVLDRIADGTRNLTGQLRTWLAVADLKGTERAKAAAVRAAGAFASAWFVGGVLYALGLLWWGGVALWLFSALAAGKAPAPAPGVPAGPKRRPRDRAREQLLAALDDITTGATGVHLWPTMYEGLRAFPRYAELDDKALRALLADHEIPVQKLTVGGIRGRNGVHRADVVALLAEAAPTPPPLPAAPSRPEEERTDLRKSSSSASASAAPEGVPCAVHELGDDTLDMLEGVSSR